MEEERREEEEKKEEGEERGGGRGQGGRERVCEGGEREKWRCVW